MEVFTIEGPRHVTLVMTHLYRCSVVSVCLFFPDVTLFVTDRADAKRFFALEHMKRGMRAELASAMLRSVGVWNCESLLSRELSKAGSQFSTFGFAMCIAKRGCEDECFNFDDDAVRWCAEIADCSAWIF